MLLFTIYSVLVSDLNNLTKELHQKLPLLSIRNQNNCHCIFIYITLFILLFVLLYYNWSFNYIIFHSSFLANLSPCQHVTYSQNCTLAGDFVTRRVGKHILLWLTKSLRFSLVLFLYVFYPTHPLPLQFFGKLVSFLMLLFTIYSILVSDLNNLINAVWLFPQGQSCMRMHTFFVHDCITKKSIQIIDGV